MVIALCCFRKIMAISPIRISLKIGLGGIADI